MMCGGLVQGPPHNHVLPSGAKRVASWPIEKTAVFENSPAFQPWAPRDVWASPAWDQRTARRPFGTFLICHRGSQR